MAMFGHQDWLAADDCGNRVLEDELLLVVGLEHDRVFIETLDLAREFHATHQIDREEGLVFARVV